MSKYNNKKCNGYDSIKEWKRSLVLKMMLKNNLISELSEQVPFVLCPAQYGIGFSGNQICLRREMKYICDFKYTEKGNVIIEDVKGFKTAEYKRKKRLMKFVFGIEIKET